MINCSVRNNDDEEIASIWVRQIPRVGEYLWFPGGKIKSQEVETVAHWVGGEWTPNTHLGEPVHSVCLYVKPVD